MNGFFLIILIYMLILTYLSMKYLSAAILIQTEGFGKERKEKILNRKKREEKEIMKDQERSSEPEPIESGPEVMQRRAEELRAMALQSKEQRDK